MRYPTCMHTEKSLVLLIMLNLSHQALEAWIARVSHPSSSVSKKGLKSCMFTALDANPRVEDRDI
jgi:hypothetical protein